MFASLAALGGTPPYTVVIGCEVDDVDEGIGLSDAGRRRRRPTPCEAIEDVVDASLVTDAKVG